MQFRVQRVAVFRIVIAHDIGLRAGLLGQLNRHRQIGQQAHLVAQGVHHGVDFLGAAAVLQAGGGDQLLHAVHHREHQVQGVHHIAGAVQRADLVRQLLAPLHVELVAGLGNLVADGVENDAGMVVVLEDHVGDVLLPVVGKARAIVIERLGGGPDVGELVHHVDAQLVAGPQQRLAHGMVGAADGIIAGLFELPHPALFSVAEGRGAQGAAVVVDAAAPQLDHLAVDPQAVLGVQLQLADAEGVGIDVAHFAAVIERGADGVEIGVVLVPEVRLLHIHSAAQLLALVGHHRDRRLDLGDHVAVGIQHLVDHTGIDDLAAGVDHGNRHLQDRQAVVQILGGDAGALAGHMEGAAHIDLHIAVNAAAGVPAAGRRGVLHHDLQDVLAGFEIVGEVHVVVAVAIVAQAHVSVIAVYGGHLIDAFKLNPHILICPFLRQLECFEIADILPLVVSLGAVGRVVDPLRGDHRVVGQRHRLGLGHDSHQGLQRAAGFVLEHPAVVE